MIIVTGEALIDLVLLNGHVAAQPGGGPFNTARTIGRLGLAPAFLGRLSQDGFGRMLPARLEQDGVAIGLPQLTDAPMAASATTGTGTASSAPATPVTAPATSAAAGVTPAAPAAPTRPPCR
jgi:fructokinase